MADQDVESRLAALEDAVLRLSRGGSGSAFRPISAMTSSNPLFLRSRITNQQIADRTRSIFIDLFTGSIRTGTPAITISGTNTRYRAWAFDATANEEIVCEFCWPVDAVPNSSATVWYWFTNLGAGSGNIAWTFTQHGVLTTTATNDLNDTTGEAAVTTILGAPSQNILTRLSFATNLLTVAPIPDGRLQFERFIIGRNGAHVSDTLGNDAGLVAVEISYLADM